jgi:hypothetical protein
MPQQWAASAHSREEEQNHTSIRLLTAIPTLKKHNMFKIRSGVSSLLNPVDRTCRSHLLCAITLEYIKGFACCANRMTQLYCEPTADIQAWLAGAHICCFTRGAVYTTGHARSILQLHPAGLAAQMGAAVTHD